MKPVLHFRLNYRGQKTKNSATQIKSIGLSFETDKPNSNRSKLKSVQSTAQHFHGMRIDTNYLCVLSLEQNRKKRLLQSKTRIQWFRAHFLLIEFIGKSTDEKINFDSTSSSLVLLSSTKEFLFFFFVFWELFFFRSSIFFLQFPHKNGLNYSC